MITSTKTPTSQKPVKPVQYPILVEYIGSPTAGSFILLLTGPTTGIVVWTDDASPYLLGHYSQNWATSERQFKPIEDSVLLKNIED